MKKKKIPHYKLCSICGEYKKLRTEFYLRATKERDNEKPKWHRYRSTCKKCYKRKRNQKYKKRNFLIRLIKLLYKKYI